MLLDEAEYIEYVVHRSFGFIIIFLFLSILTWLGRALLLERCHVLRQTFQQNRLFLLAPFFFFLFRQKGAQARKEKVAGQSAAGSI